MGIDVSARSLAVCLEAAGQGQLLEFDNKPTGHMQLIRRLTQRKRRARVVVEASGIYSFDLALALHNAEGVEVMLANPRTVRDFAKALLQRSKTDPLDAAVLLEFARRMPFQPWSPPAPEALELRALARRIASLVTRPKARRRTASTLPITAATCRL